MDETGTHYTEWRKSEREREMSYTDTYMWDLDRWHWWIYSQGSNGETDIENNLWFQKVKRGGGGIKKELEILSIKASV